MLYTSEESTLSALYHLFMVRGLCVGMELGTMLTGPKLLAVTLAGQVLTEDPDEIHVGGDYLPAW
jgi:hypothetical protein